MPRTSDPQGGCYRWAAAERRGYSDVCRPVAIVEQASGSAKAQVADQERGGDRGPEYEKEPGPAWDE